MADVDEQVKAHPYDGTRRQARSAETRQRIIDVARDLIVADGYHATTIAGIATQASVNVDTVYELVGRKAVLLRELIEQAISGTDHAVAPDERGYVQAIKAEPHPATKLAIYAHAICRIQERMAPLLLALRDASSTEPEANQIWHEISNRRAENMRHLIRDIQDSGGLRGDLTIDEAADVLWALNSSEVFLLFTAEHGWSTQKLEHWLSDTWRLVLLN